MVLPQVAVIVIVFFARVYHSNYYQYQLPTVTVGGVHDGRGHRHLLAATLGMLQLDNKTFFV